MKLVIGLGNPTRKYRLTRHNVGFLAVDRIAKDLSVKLKKDRSLNSLVGEGKLGDEGIFFLEPLTFMNRSGLAIRDAVALKKMAPEDLLVVCDDADLEFGKIRMRKSGSSGGHNGLKSIIEHLQTEDFVRLRIGIGRKESSSSSLSEYVLDKFDRGELVLVEKVLDVVSKAIKMCFEEGIEKAMTNYNNIVVS